MFRRIAPLIGLISACAQTPTLTVPPLAQAAEDTCNAAQYANLIGQDATALERVLLMGPVRVIRPGMAVTMDYSPERINFAVDADQRVAAITCG